ncbi:MAG TPA: hypothetical protein VGP76_20780 [Planctomycetaceae bacterium]|jgi:hypothetical protein|nr:hypothetical protein [Planctomycetaceae bacterium]
MRTVVIGLGLWTVLTLASAARAQSPGQQAYEKDELRSAVRPMTPAERVHERAAVEAHARLSRIEYRHAMGISLQRPTMYSAPPYYQPAVYVAPWGIYGSCPVPYTVWLP